MNNWNQILRKKVYSPHEPDDFVMSFVALLKGEKTSRVLDLSCGAGRHLIYAAKQGFEAYGIDFSGTGLIMAKKRLKKQKLNASLVRCDMRTLPFVSSFFDAVVCTRAIYHQKLAAMQETISEIRRVLSKKGFVLADFLSRKTYSYGKGVKVEEHTFIEEEGVEKGVIHHFTDKKELRRLFEDFKILNLDLSEKEVEGKLRSRWVITATIKMDSELGK